MPLMVGRTPWSAADALVGLPTAGCGWCHWAKSGSRGTRADQGVRPTSHAGFPVLRRISEIRHSCLPRPGSSGRGRVRLCATPVAEKLFLCGPFLAISGYGNAANISSATVTVERKIAFRFLKPIARPHEHCALAAIRLRCRCQADRSSQLGSVFHGRLGGAFKCRQAPNQLRE
jgi:hypothetical protein